MVKYSSAGVPIDGPNSAISRRCRNCGRVIIFSRGPSGTNVRVGKKYCRICVVKKIEKLEAQRDKMLNFLKTFVNNQTQPLSSFIKEIESEA